MKFEIYSQYIKKKVPLKISREVIYGQDNVFLKVRNSGFAGIGEAVFDEAAEQSIEAVTAFLEQQQSYAPVTVWEAAHKAGLDGRQKALIDLALWDLLCHQAGMPLYRMLGLERVEPDTSITLSIGERDWVYERTIQVLQQFNPNLIKIKLGSKEGIMHDKQSFLAIVEAIEKTATKPVRLFVDANGGWNLKDAKTMLHWLAKHNVEFVEQPLPVEKNAELAELFVNRPLPIYVDESCHYASDVRELYPMVDGVNIKLLKCGGITEALRIVHAARAMNLNVMLGCFGETAGSLAGAVSLAPLVDYIDLDSFLNLEMDGLPDYQFDLQYRDGKLGYGNQPGLGVRYD